MWSFRNWGDYREEEVIEIYLKEARQIEFRNRFYEYMLVLNYVIETYPQVENELDSIIHLIEIRITELEK